MVKVLIFDLGGVVLTNDWHDGNPKKIEEFSKTYGINEEDMERAWNVAWPDYRIGNVTEDAFWYYFLTEAGVKNPKVKKAAEIQRKHQREMESMLDLLTRLKPHNRLASLTNISKEWLDHKRERFGLDEHFETIISSGYAGVGKPNLEIYKLILDELEIKGYESVFIDNMGKNFPSAIKLGMRPIPFTSQSALETELGSRGIEFERIESIK